jgi:hypothetical protein
MDTPALIQKSNRYCAYALIFFSLALVTLSIGVFIDGPTSAFGILSACVGVIFMLCCIVCFVLYSYYLRKAEK